MASVKIENLTKNYGSVEVLHGIDLAVEEGQFIVLLGPSGCGKSTLLRMIAGLEDVTSGDIFFDDNRVNDISPKDRNIAMVFQNYALYAHMTVRDNMAFSMRLKRVKKSLINERVQWASSILGLDPYLDRRPKALSGGQRQRVAMGRAIVRDPEVFLFDEPLSNLDAKLRVQMRTEIKDLHQRLKTTTIYVTHDQIEAMTMADVIVIMRDGVIEQSGRPLDIYDNPANLFVAQFIGSPGMNMIKGTIAEENDQFFFQTDECRLPLPKGVEVSAEQEVIYGIRPEHLVPAKDGVGLPVTISVVEPTGPEIHYYCTFVDQEIRFVTKERMDWQPGVEIRLSPMQNYIHLFDAKSKKAIKRG